MVIAYNSSQLPSSTLAFSEGSISCTVTAHLMRCHSCEIGLCVAISGNCIFTSIQALCCTGSTCAVFGICLGTVSHIQGKQVWDPWVYRLTFGKLSVGIASVLGWVSVCKQCVVQCNHGAYIVDDYLWPCVPQCFINSICWQPLGSVLAYCHATSVKGALSRSCESKTRVSRMFHRNVVKCVQGKA